MCKIKALLYGCPCDFLTIVWRLCRQDEARRMQSTSTRTDIVRKDKYWSRLSFSCCAFSFFVCARALDTVMLCIDRCPWRRAWTKPSSTSAESWSTRPTTSTSPNPKLRAWRKDGPDTTESRHRLFIPKMLMRTLFSRQPLRTSQEHCSEDAVKLSGTGVLFFNSFVFLKRRHFFSPPDSLKQTNKNK